MKEESNSSYSENNQEFEQEEEEEKPRKISVKVKWIKTYNDDNDSDNEEEQKQVEQDLTFKIDENVPLRWLMILYCDKIGVDFNYTRFEFKGVRLRDTDTPCLLSMVPFDVIDAFHFSRCLYGRNAAIYTTVCIRMHNARDTFLRVKSTAPLLPQLLQGLSDCGPQEEGSLCFVYEGIRLSGDDRVDGLDIVDGDIIDAFNFKESSYFLSIIDSRRPITLKVVHENHKDCNFRVKRSTRLRQLVRRYSEIELLACDIILLHKGRRLMESQTVEEAGLEDGDEIRARLIVT